MTEMEMGHGYGELKQTEFTQLNLNQTSQTSRTNQTESEAKKAPPHTYPLPAGRYDECPTD